MFLTRLRLVSRDVYDGRCSSTIRHGGTGGRFLEVRVINHKFTMLSIVSSFTTLLRGGRCEFWVFMEFVWQTAQTRYVFRIDVFWRRSLAFVLFFIIFSNWCFHHRSGLEIMRLETGMRERE